MKSPHVSLTRQQVSPQAAMPFSHPHSQRLHSLPPSPSYPPPRDSQPRSPDAELYSRGPHTSDPAPLFPSTAAGVRARCPRLCRSQIPPVAPALRYRLARGPDVPLRSDATPRAAVRARR